MNPLTRLCALVTLALGLVACFSDPLADAETQSIPAAEVSTTKARIGEPVQVTLTTTIFAAQFRDSIVEGGSLGVCFWLQSYTSKGGACEGLSTPLPTPLHLAANESFEKSFDRTVIEAGSSRMFTHTFSFTSSEPGSVTLGAQFGEVNREGRPIYPGYIERETVITFDR